jgi:hypothetical protein
MASVVLPALDASVLPASLSQLLAAAAEERPHGIAIVGEGDEEGVTFVQLRDAAMRVAERLMCELRHQQQQHPQEQNELSLNDNEKTSFPFSSIGVLLSDTPLFMLAPCACSFAALPFCYLGAPQSGACLFAPSPSHPVQLTRLFRP